MMHRPRRLLLAASFLLAAVSAGCGAPAATEAPAHRPELEKAVDPSKPAAKTLKPL